MRRRLHRWFQDLGLFLGDLASSGYDLAASFMGKLLIVLAIAVSLFLIFSVVAVFVRLVTNTINWGWTGVWS